MTINSSLDVKFVPTMTSAKAKDNEWLVVEIITHQWTGTKVSFLVQWNLRDTTWEPYSECKDLMALDRYLELLGIEGKD